MDLTGKISNFEINPVQMKTVLTLNINENVDMSDLKDAELSIKLEKRRKRRSLDANAYFHVLVDKIAVKSIISKVMCKNLMIARYGQIEIIEDEPVIIKTNIPVDKMLEQELLHCHPVKAVMENGKEIVFYKVYRGSSTYNTQEMAALIDGTVMEAKGMGIETMTANELEKMKALWGVQL